MRRGGSIIATHETSLYDEWGARRKNFGLVRWKVEERVQNSYLTVHPHPLTTGLDGVPRVIGAVKRVHVKAASQFSPALTLIRPIPTCRW